MKIRTRITFLLLMLLLLCHPAWASNDDTNQSSIKPAVSDSLDFSKEEGLKFRESNSIGVSLVVNIVLAIGFLTLILYVVLLVVKKQGWFGLPKDEEGKSEIKTLAVKRLAGKTLLFVVEIEGQRFAICQNDNAIKFEKLETSD